MGLEPVSSLWYSVLSSGSWGQVDGLLYLTFNKLYKQYYVFTRLSPSRTQPEVVGYGLRPSADIAAGIWSLKLHQPPKVALWDRAKIPSALFTSVESHADILAAELSRAPCSARQTQRCSGSLAKAKLRKQKRTPLWPTARKFPEGFLGVQWAAGVNGQTGGRSSQVPRGGPGPRPAFLVRWRLWGPQVGIASREPWDPFH